MDGTTSERVKYPRTPHIASSPGASADDITTSDLGALGGAEVVATVKLDGEATTLLRDGTHARSTSTAPHPSRDWLRAWHSTIAHELPDGYRFCGENVYAQHALAYTELASFFYLYNVWDGQRCLSWEDTVEWAALLSVPTVPVF